MVKRSSDDIIYKVIELLLYSDLNKTNLMYKANMSHTQQAIYMESMAMDGFIREVEKGKWRVLPKGLEFYIQKRIEKVMFEYKARLE